MFTAVVYVLTSGCAWRHLPETFGVSPATAHRRSTCERLGRHRWKIERSNVWLFGFRRLTVRYERKGSHFLALLGLAAALTCYKKLAKLAT